MGIYPSRDDKKKRDQELWENIERVAGRHNSLIKHCDHNFVIHNLGKKKKTLSYTITKKKLCHHYMGLKDVFLFTPAPLNRSPFHLLVRNIFFDQTFIK